MQRSSLLFGDRIIQFLTAQAILHLDDLNNRMNCIRMIGRIG